MGAQGLGQQLPMSLVHPHAPLPGDPLYGLQASCGLLGLQLGTPSVIRMYVSSKFGSWRGASLARVAIVAAVGVPPDGLLDCKMERMLLAAALSVASSEALGICTRTVPAPHWSGSVGKVIIPKRAIVP